MDELMEYALLFKAYVIEMDKYLIEENKYFPQIGRMLECSSGICDALRAARKKPESSHDSYTEVISLAEEFQNLMGLMVKNGVLTELQSKPLITDSKWFKAKASSMISEE